SSSPAAILRGEILFGIALCPQARVTAEFRDYASFHPNQLSPPHTPAGPKPSDRSPEKTPPLAYLPPPRDAKSPNRSRRKFARPAASRLVRIDPKYERHRVILVRAHTAIEPASKAPVSLP